MSPLSLLAFGPGPLPGVGLLLNAWNWFKGFLKRIPWQVWLAIGVAMAILIGIHVIDRKISDARKEGYAAGVAAEKEAVATAQAKADALQRAKNQAHATASAKIDTGVTNALLDTNDDIDRRAAAIRMQHDAAIASGAGVVRPLPATIVAPGGAAASPGAQGLSFDLVLELATDDAKLRAQLNAVLDWEDQQDALAAKDGTDGGDPPTAAEGAAAGP